MDAIKAIGTKIKSYFKAKWDFNDYPIKIWKNPNAGDNKVAYGACIVNWTNMVGHGATSEEALKALKVSFNRYKDNNDVLPRPGTKVPLKFASTANIDKYEKTALDFFKRILNMNFYEGFYSDESALSNFEPYDNEERTENIRCETIKRTLLLYNVDITDIYDEPLWIILDKIETKK
jgi:hypothetical protein